MSESGASVAAGGADWGNLIRARLAGSAPRHSPRDWLVPGLTAAQSRELSEFFPPDPIPAAVLVPIVERDPGPTVLLTQRNAKLRHHPGQVSFPGGRLDPPDESPRAAALREAREEVGLDPALIEVVGYLPDHIIISGFRVTPVVGFVRPPFKLALQAGEVEDAFEVPLAHLFDPANHRARRRPMSREPGAVEVQLWDIPFGERQIWGATAGMLMTLYRLCVLGDEPPGSSILAGVASGLPPLARAVELSRHAGRVGFDWTSSREVRAKVLEELSELDAAAAQSGAADTAGPGAEPRAAVSNPASAAVREELGDLLFAVANWGRHLGADPEVALAAANAKFERRFAWMERTARERALELQALSATAWEGLWRESKAAVG